MTDVESMICTDRHVVVATLGDPRLQFEAHEFDRRTLKSRLDACRLAGQWAERRYWISVCSDSGECVLEIPLT